MVLGITDTTLLWNTVRPKDGKVRLALNKNERNSLGISKTSELK